ncbi:AAA family ATPase [uncultured Selenomonas sp.]|uniref:AAA family ATPase n=1 Tax=uncultured Selenomonas sp. TaxID=159275 RepID=UPI0025E385AE|nr:AAA family ATPase [uncultured Selenomonas sp.]
MKPREQDWTLHIERLGAMRQADIALAPLMCFVGDNNSGKSYISMLLWGLLSQGMTLFPNRPSDGKAYVACEQWMMQNQNRDITMDASAEQRYIAWFNEILAQKKIKLMEKIFNYPIHIGKIEIEDFHRHHHLKVQWKSDAQRFGFSNDKNCVKFPVKDRYTRDDLLRMNSYLCWNLLTAGMTAPFFTNLLQGRRQGEPVYMPASRTGFMLTYSQLLASSLQANFGEDEGDRGERGRLTLPYIDFLQLITKFEEKEKPQEQKLVRFLEENMAQGAFHVKKDFLPQIRYETDQGVSLPLYVTSSVITEIAPILLLLKSGISFNAIIIEEPEAHLHPELQRRMARFIVQLMNSGKTVLITTHSDTIMQHINNMLKLRHHPRKAELMEKWGYDEADLLEARKVHVYEFDHHTSAETSVRDLKVYDDGIVIPTFNDALADFNEEIYAVQEDS